MILSCVVVCASIATVMNVHSVTQPGRLILRRKLATLFLLCAVLAHPGVEAQAASTAAQPNVLFIAVDDLNDWVGCLKGHPDAITPNIDRLAARGTVFANAHCTAPLCGPSRASLMTGLRPSTTGIYTHIADNKLREVCEATRTTPFLHEWFGQRGYETLAVGKLFHQHVPSGTVDQSGGAEGFGPKPDRRMNWEAKGTLTDWGAFPDSDPAMPDYRAATWAVERLREPRPRPFFLGVGFYRPHVPWHVPQKWFDLHPRHKAEPPPYLTNDFDDIPELSRRIADMPMMPTTEWAIANDQWRDIIQAYLACVTFADAQVGRVLDALDASPAGTNTIIVLWGDHGYHLGEKNRFAKQALWDRATRAPLILVTPHGKGGQVCSQPVSLLDLYPTLLDLAGLPPNPANEGRSLKPLLEQPDRDWPYPAVTTWGRNHHGVRDARYHYLRLADGSEELYDHVEDPNEWRNLAGEPDRAGVKERLAQALPKLNAPWVSGLNGGSPWLEEEYKQARGTR
jgi:arylsulfatase A-like enzyme